MVDKNKEEIEKIKSILFNGDLSEALITEGKSGLIKLARIAENSISKARYPSIIPLDFGFDSNNNYFVTIRLLYF
ncbi:hypothetical protein [Methylovorus sp. MP688]|uniref:hypothetical protein n=1 Tax=Methylovorus sp. (strain MP688) TaxID=887061 RepID=UPI0011D04020|nr:hypothetical protein [Methylovorus sp. MP688]